MGMRIVARKIAETPVEARYEFGLDENFNRILVIDKGSWRFSTVDGKSDSITGKICAKIKDTWETDGEFPTGAIFSS